MSERESRVRKSSGEAFQPPPMKPFNQGASVPRPRRPDSISERERIVAQLGELDRRVVALEEKLAARARRKTPKRSEFSAEVVTASAEVVGLLNEQSGFRYKAATPTTLKAVARLLGEGYTVRQIKATVAHRCVEWLRSPMARYLRPQTLLGQDKFAEYYAQAEKAYRDDGRPIE